MMNARAPQTIRVGKLVAGVGLLIATSLFMVACGGSSNSSNNTSRVTA